jgi:hypothetical protein
VFGVEARLKQGVDSGKLDTGRASPGATTDIMSRAPLPPQHAPLSLLASLDGVEVALSILQRPAQAGQVYVVPVTGGQMQAVQASRLTLLGWSGT